MFVWSWLLQEKKKCLGMMTATVVLAFMLVTCLQGQGHVILRTCLADMGGNIVFHYVEYFIKFVTFAFNRVV